MRNREELAIDIVSAIDDDIVEESLQKRFELWFKRKQKPNNKKWISIIAAAASFAIVLTSAFLLWSFLKAPVYLGMSVSNEAPKVNSAMVDIDELTPIALNADDAMLMPMYLNNTNYEGNNGNHGNKDKSASETEAETTEETTTNPPPEFLESKTYYAMPGEDIYIHVHISNPNEYEILSFTLNGVKYSSYMFEDGSDLETLILKYNVGEVEGLKEYTIDAIKYVDGEAIKDVRMKGDQTIEVVVGVLYLNDETIRASNIPNGTYIQRVCFGGNVKKVSVGAFSSYVALEEVILAEDFAGDFPSDAFAESNKLTKITVEAGNGVYRAENNCLIRKDTNTLIWACTGLSEITVPKSVVSIDEQAFRYCKLLTNIQLEEGNSNCRLENNCLVENASGKLIWAYGDSIAIPEGVESIGKYAFVNCNSITNIVIPDTVTSIEKGAFEGFSIKKAVIPASAIADIPWKTLETVVITSGEIGKKAFYGCTTLVDVIVLDAVTSIGDFAFAGCKGVSNVIIGNGVTTIGVSAFEECSNLTSITIPDSVINISDFAFNGCFNLTITMSSENPNYRFEDNCLIEKANNKLMLCLNNGVIPEGVVIIGSNAFSNRTALNSITIPNSVTHIESSAFDECTNITSVTAPSHAMKYIPKNNIRTVVMTSGTSISDSAFSGCSGLTSISIPDSVTSIGDSAFRRCTSLTSISLPESVESIGNSAFSGCSGLTSISIPESVESICDSAFSGCGQLTSISIPNTITSLNGAVFSDCKNLNIEVSAQHPIYRIEDNCLIEKATNKLVFFSKGATIPQSVVSIADYAFSACVDSSNITSITIHNAITSVGDNAFYGSVKIEVTLDASLLTILPTNGVYALVITGGDIPEQAFISCTSLKKLTIHDGVRSIGKKAFFECSNLSQVTIPDSVTSIGDKAFDECSITKATVPAFAIEYIRNYKTFADPDLGHCCMLTELVVTSGNIGRTHCAVLQRLTICDGVTSIGDWAFYYCPKLTYVSIADSVKTIGEGAFAECYSLRTITISDSVTTIGAGAFGWCYALQSITIPEGVKRIEANTFERCTNLKTITISNNIEYISNDAFGDEYADYSYVVETIIFKGTKDEWGALGVSFSTELPQIQVQCTDGTITI